MIDYKKLGIKAFYKGSFDEAINYFSLAYDKKKDKRLLFFIMICSLAKTRHDEAMMLFEIFKVKEKVGMSAEDLDEILATLESKFDEKDELEAQNAISYDDFMDAVKKEGNFKSVFEDIMFSTRVMINNRDDFLDFLENLIKNDFIEMGLNYLESVAVLFAGDERLNSLICEINKRRKSENLH
ncbi:histidine kinase [Campylobacter sp. RM16188]|uniref:histidine kinase n=1 Tax=Campylobacter sp. RM16188 TaxID=1705725 RepID=UPI001554CD2A|nr:histidine kinase [Campylobacter sp. RM16188]